MLSDGRNNPPSRISFGVLNESFLTDVFSVPSSPLMWSPITYVTPMYHPRLSNELDRDFLYLIPF